MAIKFDKIGQGVISSAGSALLSAGIGALTGSSSAHYQRRNFRENTDYAHAINIRDAKNKYRYELQALRSAGVNTAMLGGDFSQAGVNPVSASADTPDTRGPNVDIAGDIGRFAQTEQAESATQLNKSTSEAQTAKARLDNAEAQRLEMTQGVFLRQAFSTLYQTAEQTEYIRSQKDFTEQQRENAAFSLYQSRLALDDTLRNLRLTGDELDARIQQIGTDISIKQQELPLQLQLLRARAFEAFQAGNLSKEQMIVCQRTCKLLDEQYEAVRLDNKFTRDTLDSKIALVNQQNTNDYGEETIRDIKLHKFLSEPKKLAEMSDAEFNKAFYEACFDGYIAEGDWNTRTTMKYLRRADMITRTVGNVAHINMGYGNFKSTNLNSNITPKSSIIQPAQGGSFDLYQAQQLINPYGK